MALDTSGLENGLKRVDQYQTIPKTFERKIRLVSGKKSTITRDASYIFWTNGINGSVTNGSNVTFSNIANPNLPILNTHISNASNKFFECLTSGNVWTFNYPTNITALSASTEDSDVFVNDGNSYTTFTTTSFNLPTAWTDDIELYIVDSSNTEHLIGWNDTITITATPTAFYRMKNTSGGNIVYSMYNNTGQPPTFTINYS